MRDVRRMRAPMGHPFGGGVRAGVERWLSGRRQRFAKPSYGLHCTGGSNPPLSAIFCMLRQRRQECRVAGQGTRMKIQDGNPTDEQPLVLFSSQDGAVTVPARLDRGDRLDMP